MKTLQTKLLIGLVPTILILVLLGLWAVVMFYRLGGNIDVILRENFRSILAAQGMKEAIERMDSGLLFAVGGRSQHGRDQFETNRPTFLKHLRIEQATITLPGEAELAASLEQGFERYTQRALEFFAIPEDPPERRAQAYFQELLPTFEQIRKDADRVLELNQENMSAMDRRTAPTRRRRSG